MTNLTHTSRGPFNVGDDAPPRPSVSPAVEAVARSLVKTHYVKVGARKLADLEMLAEKWWPDFVGDAKAAIAAYDATKSQPL